MTGLISESLFAESLVHLPRVSLHSCGCKGGSGCQRQEFLNLVRSLLVRPDVYGSTSSCIVLSCGGAVQNVASLTRECSFRFFHVLSQ